MQPVTTNTIGKVLHQLTGMLTTSPTARLDAEVLTGFACQLTREQLITRDQSEISEKKYNELMQLVKRRINGEPIAYLTGKREFYSLALSINSQTLIPRPETELLVDLALEKIPENKSFRLVDLGTGSGAIALAIARNRPDCQIVATDYSADALQVAAGNAQQLAIENIEFRRGNWFAALENKPVHMIVSNPPYIAENDPHLAQGDVRFEPETALVSGPEGLNDIKLITSQARNFLVPGGILMLEHGAQQAQNIHTIFSAAGAANICCHQDLTGLDRVSSCTF